MSEPEKLIDILRESGSDLSQVHELDFYFYFNSTDDADKLMQVLISEEFSAEVNESAEYWLCLATKKFLPENEDFSQLEKDFNSLAQRYNGQYDGWEARVED